MMKNDPNKNWAMYNPDKANPAEKPTGVYTNAEVLKNKMDYAKSLEAEKPTATNYGGGYAPTAQDHIRDLHDAATRFEDRAKRAEAQAAQLAEAYTEICDLIMAIPHGIDPRIRQLARDRKALAYEEGK